MTLGFLDIDFGSSDAAHLVEAMDSSGLRGALPSLTRAFLIRSPWAPGFRFVGAQARRGGASALSFSVGGGALSVDQALMACVGEAAERLSQVQRPGDLQRKPIEPGDKRISAATGSLCDTLVPAARRSRVAWVRGRDLSGAIRLVPADWCLRRSRYGALRIPGSALSTGCAAARTFDDAVAGGLLELIERDAAALWWNGVHTAKPVAPDPATKRLIETLRGASDTRRTWLLDITPELQVPVIVALSAGTGDRGLAIGVAARPTSVAAARAALFELCQMEIGLQLAALKRTARGEVGLSDDDRRHLARARIRIGGDPRFDALPQRRPRPLSDAAPVSVTKALAAHAIDAVAVDLSRSEIGVGVAKVIAPQLQLLPGDIVTDRLKERRIAAGMPPIPRIPLH